MTKEFKIVVPDGYEIDEANSSFERIVFKKIISRPKSWDEFCATHPWRAGEFIIGLSSDLATVDGPSTRNPQRDRNLLPSHRAAHQHLALMQLHQLRDCYRQGWVPDWSDATKKWCVILINGCIKVCYSMATSHFLSFDSADTAKEFAMNFPDLISQAGDLI